MKEVSLTQGYIAKVDDEDYARVIKYKWRIHKVKQKNGAKLYARRSTNIKGIGKVNIPMQRYILNLPLGKDILVDHKDNDGLNNQKENLRLATYSENSRNMPKNQKSVSQYKGVQYLKNEKYQKWLPFISIKHRDFDLGLCETELIAAKRRDAYAKELYGEFVHLNFPNEETDASLIKPKKMARLKQWMKILTSA